MLTQESRSRGDRITLSLVIIAVFSTGMAWPGEEAPQGTSSGTGQSLFETKCAACHSLGSDRVVGPGLEGVARRRDREWLSAMIADPAKMIGGEDSIAARLYAEYGVPMPDLGLTSSEVEAIVEFLEETAAGAAPQAGASEAVGGTPSEAEGDPSAGRAIFTGERRLANDGPACISCHSATGLGVTGGGTLARDLSQAAITYGSGLRSVLRTTPFPVMQDVFVSRPLSGEEIADLSAFLETTAEAEPGAARAGGLAFPLSGIGGAVLLVLLAGLIWRGRLNGVRKALIGGGR